jgi:hypothetical protein
MHLPRLGILLISILLLGEAALALWRHLPVEPSTAPVFTFPPAAANFDKPGSLAPAIAMYGADRGAEWSHSTADGTRLTVFYFEWDAFRIGFDAMKDIAIHAPEVCNTAAGFELQEILPERTDSANEQNPLRFDTTRFTDPSGRTVYIFKMVWIQGRGSMAFREQGLNRIERAKNSLLRHQGAARVLQAGVFDARDADHAWQSLREQVLDHLEWR